MIRICEKMLKAISANIVEIKTIISVLVRIQLVLVPVFTFCIMRRLAVPATVVPITASESGTSIRTMLFISYFKSFFNI